MPQGGHGDRAAAWAGALHRRALRELRRAERPAAVVDGSGHRQHRRARRQARQREGAVVLTTCAVLHTGRAQERAARKVRKDAAAPESADKAKAKLTETRKRAAKAAKDAVLGTN